MVADRRTTFEGSLLGPYRINKIKRGRAILVASSGNGVFADLLNEALAPSPPDELRVVAEVFRAKGPEIGGHALALTRDGICEITSKGGIVWVEADFWAIGSGYQFGIGYLAGIEAAGMYDITIEPSHAMDAITVAAKHVNDVGDGMQLERLS